MASSFLVQEHFKVTWLDDVNDESEPAHVQMTCRACGGVVVDQVIEECTPEVITEKAKEAARICARHTADHLRQLSGPVV